MQVIHVTQVHSTSITCTSASEATALWRYRSFIIIIIIIMPVPPVNCQFIWMASAFGISATQPILG